MSDAILIFTFSPVQSFISEARRSADLYSGSRILVELARAVTDSIGWNNIVYPSREADIPNRMVATVPAERATEMAQQARTALLARWDEIAASASTERAFAPYTGDRVWQTIWRRQTSDSYLWEIFWATAELKSGSQEDYQEAYSGAERRLQAIKYDRLFVQAVEPGYKDTLSGKREALHTETLNGRQFWSAAEISGATSRIVPMQLRPNGRERLDALGLIRRFSEIARSKRVGSFRHFPSTGSIASADFLASVESSPELTAYRNAVEAILVDDKYKVRTDGEWRFDGDLFYEDELTPQRLRTDYGLNVDVRLLSVARGRLHDLMLAARGRPSPYYGIIALDGDDIGKRIKACSSADEHKKFSSTLASFSDSVRDIVPRYFGEVIYNGGDDVLALAPLSAAASMAKELAAGFERITGSAASAGIAITHYVSPLGAALEAVREAEGAAKRVPGKSAVCIRLLKRSGEPAEMVSHWDDGSDLFGLATEYFRGDGGLSSRFAYEVIGDAYGGSALPPDARRALLKRLVKRHSTGRLPDPGAFTDGLHAWSMRLDECAPKLKSAMGEVPQGMSELGKWLSFARFVAQGGGE